MWQHCMNSDTNTISRCDESENLQKPKTKSFFKQDTYCLLRQKAMAFKVALNSKFSAT